MHVRRAWLVSAIVIGTLSPPACDDGERSLIETGPRTRSSAQLVAFDTCDELGAALKENLKEEMRTRLLQAQDHYWGSPEVMVDEGANASADSAGGRQEGVDFSGTNNQEEGVDEADFVKTDGYFIYMINGNRLEILEVPEFGDLVALSTTRIEGRPSQMMVGDDAAVIFSQLYPWNVPDDHPLREQVFADAEYGWYRSEVLTKITVLDITERQNPTLARELYLEGYYQTARKVASAVRMVNHTWISVPGLSYWPELPDSYWEIPWDDPRREEIFLTAARETARENDRIIDATPVEELVPRLYERLPNNAFIEHAYTNEGCVNFAMAEDGTSHAFTSILSLDLLGDSFDYEADHIVTNWSTVYASQDVMLIAEPANDWWWFWNNEEFEEATNIHRFDISEGATTSYTGSGRVAGTILDQFSLSEQDGYVRVAATTGQWNRWWMEDPEEPENHVYVLGGEDGLEVVGHLGGIAVGERIWSSRFAGDKAYLVTFRNIDPLWTISLAEPTDPKIIGELEVPGVSTYIHPIEQQRLLNIGFGGDESGLDWKTQISLFNVSDFANPTLQDSLSLAPPAGDGWSWAWSEATYEHKAFQYWAPKKLLAVPVTSYRYNYDEQEGYQTYEYLSRLTLINVDATEGLSVYGTIDHSDFFNSASDTWWGWTDVRRSIFMGDFIYAISCRGVTVHELETMQLRVSLPLTGPTDDPYWHY